MCTLNLHIYPPGSNIKVRTIIVSIVLHRNKSAQVKHWIWIKLIHYLHNDKNALIKQTFAQLL